MMPAVEKENEIQSAASAFAESLRTRALGFEEQEEVPETIYQKLADLGLMSVSGPVEFGGSEAGAVAYANAMMEIASACPSTAVTMAVTNMVGEVIAEFGSAEQKKKYIPKLASGRHGAFALSEADAGSDPGGMRTTARPFEGGYRIQGSKQWISHADTAAVLVVWARTKDRGNKGLTAFLVDEHAEGLSMAKKESKMGLRASHTMAINLDNVEVPHSAILGELDRGFRIAMMALDGGRIGIASQAVGMARRGLALAKQAVASAQDDQGILFGLADAEASLAASEELALRAARLKRDGEPFSKAASMAKLYASEAAGRVLRFALRTVDPLSAAYDEVSFLLRASRVTRIYEGTSEIQRIVIGRHALSA